MVTSVRACAVPQQQASCWTALPPACAARERTSSAAAACGVGGDAVPSWPRREARGGSIGGRHSRHIAISPARCQQSDAKGNYWGGVASCGQVSRPLPLLLACAILARRRGLCGQAGTHMHTARLSSAGPMQLQVTLEHRRFFCTMAGAFEPPCARRRATRAPGGLRGRAPSAARDSTPGPRTQGAFRVFSGLP